MDTVPLSNDPKYYAIDLLARAYCMQLSITKRLTLQYYKFECVFSFLICLIAVHMNIQQGLPMARSLIPGSATF